MKIIVSEYYATGEGQTKGGIGILHTDSKTTIAKLLLL